MDPEARRATALSASPAWKERVGLGEDFSLGTRALTATGIAATAMAAASNAVDRYFTVNAPGSMHILDRDAL